MVPDRRAKSRGLLRVASGRLIVGALVALAIIGVDEGKGGEAGQQPHASAERQANPSDPIFLKDGGSYQPRCEHPQSREDAEYCEQGRATKAAKEQAKWTLYQLVVGVAGIFAVVATLFFTARAANAAKVAAKALPVLERAYVYSIAQGENFPHAIEQAQVQYMGSGKTPTADTGLWAKVRFKNYGKTPARLIGGELSIVVTPEQFGVVSISDLPIKFEHILGHDDETEDVDCWMEENLTIEQALAIEKGDAVATVSGWMD
ncbi:MAG: hypothetical protein ABI906_05530 [Pseudomonadota bacterium]